LEQSSLTKNGLDSAIVVRDLISPVTKQK